MLWAATHIVLGTEYLSLIRSRTVRKPGRFHILDLFTPFVVTFSWSHSLSIPSPIMVTKAHMGENFDHC